MACDDHTLAQVRDAYSRLTSKQLQLFCTLRSLPITGSDDDLANRLAHHDAHTYSFPSAMNGHSAHTSALPASPRRRVRPVKAPDLPVELMAEIMDHVGDWELSKAVGIPTSLAKPTSWTRASQMDHAMLTGYLPLIRATDPASHPPTRVGAEFTVRFAYIHVLEFLLTQYPTVFRSVFKNDILPITASHHGQISALSWWQSMRVHHPDLLPIPSRNSMIDIIDGASRNGQAASLDWWLHSGITLEYTEAALEMASAKNQIEVLQWWKDYSVSHNVHLKIGRAMDMASTAGHVEALEWWARSQLDFKYDRQAMYHASCHGKVDVLQWWLSSGLQLIFDPDCLVGATRHNRPEVLEWWNKSGLPIQYRMCDIEEALEDAIGGGEAAREWWKKQGVDFNANDTEWMKLQNLN
ncbi:hypothetical protein BXZ70DRAFT_955412 [Cristinia sonorae]|uniref:SAP domain-containing protein n=1 Tax=Cristinia sonorae TaxID=1940300 RepID=A0A8K0XLF2_9AGAR|nr:hypothetical protein BXZ70DRAFT_955412 [Cristinia sonorae]